MKYYKVECDTDYCGESCECIIQTERGDETIDNYVQDCCRNNADSYGAIDRAMEEAEESGFEFEESEAYSYCITPITEEAFNDERECGATVTDIK